MINVYVDNKPFFSITEKISVFDIKQKLFKQTGLQESNTYALYNGRRVEDKCIISNGNVRIMLKILGGKGGFGSMLRAIGAQIEKTTNREACRDLSGRRLRDINEEKRLKAWINNKPDREQEAVERRQQKIERLCSKPKHEFHDKDYDEERAKMTENVADSVEIGFQSTSGANTSKRKSDTSIKQKAKKKSRLWIDADEEDLSLSDSSDEEHTSSTQNSDSDANLGEQFNSIEANSVDVSENSEEPIIKEQKTISIC